MLSTCTCISLGPGRGFITFVRLETDSGSDIGVESDPESGAPGNGADHGTADPENGSEPAAPDNGADHGKS